MALRLPERSQAIAFRNILIRGYDSIDDGIVWRTIHESLPALRARVAALLDEMGSAQAEGVALENSVWLAGARSWVLRRFLVGYSGL